MPYLIDDIFVIESSLYKTSPSVKEYLYPFAESVDIKSNGVVVRIVDDKNGFVYISPSANHTHSGIVDEINKVKDGDRLSDYRSYLGIATDSGVEIIYDNEKTFGLLAFNKHERKERAMPCRKRAKKKISSIPKISKVHKKAKHTRKADAYDGCIYEVRDGGDVIESYEYEEDAIDSLMSFIDDDIDNGIFTPNKYSIACVDEKTGETQWVSYDGEYYDSVSELPNRLRTYCNIIGLPADATNFVCDYLYAYDDSIEKTLADCVKYDISWNTFTVLTDQELNDELKYYDCDSVEEYEEEYGASVYTDPSFNGNLVIREGAVKRMAKKAKKSSMKRISSRRFNKIALRKLAGVASDLAENIKEDLEYEGPFDSESDVYDFIAEEIDNQAFIYYDDVWEIAKEYLNPMDLIEKFYDEFYSDVMNDIYVEDYVKDDVEAKRANKCKSAKRFIKRSSTVKDYYGDDVDYDSATQLMDKDLAEQLHNKLAPCSDQQFFDEYAKAHEEKFNEEFAPYYNGAW